LLKVVDGRICVHALVKFGKARLVVPIETIGLKDRKQGDYIAAYKEWLG
jgi:hypothetical protein